MGFERDNNQWKKVSGGSRTGRNCVVRAHSKNCVYVLYYGSEPSKIRNTLKNVEGGQVGDLFELSFFVLGDSIRAEDFIIQIIIKGSEPKKKYTCYSSMDGTFLYTRMTCAALIDRPFDTMQVTFEYAGKEPSYVWLDKVQLKKTA